MNKKYNLIIFLVIVLAVFSRLFISIPNFSAIGSLALFCGAIVNRKRLSILLPFTTLLAGDLILAMSGKLYSDYFMDGYFAYVYVAFALTWFIGKQIKNRPQFKYIALASVLASVSFFIITNFGSWLQILEYSKDLSGLGQAYLAGLVFYKNELTSNFFLNQVMGDLFFNTVFFGMYAYALSKPKADLVEAKVSA